MISLSPGLTIGTFGSTIGFYKTICFGGSDLKNPNILSFF